jgi:putative ATP-dependent endonuclease of OLD family
MKLKNIRIKNYRSIVDSGDIRIESLQAFVGENNSGKSNILHAIETFLIPGRANVQIDDFFNPTEKMVITATFSDLSDNERKRLRTYLVGDSLILEKHIELQEDKKSGNVRPVAEYHGYTAKPKNWWLSIDGVIEHEGDKPKWQQIASDNGIMEHVTDSNGKVTKTSYEAGLKKLIVEDDSIEFEEPELGKTQALGLQPVLLDLLPSFHILPAITDFSVGHIHR